MARVLEPQSDPNIINAEHASTEHGPSPSGRIESSAPPPITAQQRWLADASLLITTIIWGANIPVVKFASSQIEPLVFNAVRMVLSTLALGTLAAIEAGWVKQPAQRFGVSRFINFALVSGLLYPLMFMWGIERTTAGNTALLLSSMPLWTAIISAVFLRERLPPLTWIAFGIAFIGTAIIVVAGGKVHFSSDNLVGNLLITASAMLWASGTVISGPLLKQVSPLRLAFFSSLLTTPIHLVIVSSKLGSVLPKLADPYLLAALIFSGVFSTGIAYSTWHVGVRRLGGSHASIYQNVVTLVAVIGGWLVLSEPILTSQILGGLLMIGGLLLMRIRPKI